MSDKTDKLRKEVTLRVTWRRSYGQHEIELGLDMDVILTSPAKRRHMYDKLMNVLDDQFMQIERERIPHLPNTDAATGAPVTHPGWDTFPVKEVRIDISKGEKRVKIAGGQYQKWGVMMYDDADFSDCADYYDMEPGVYDVSHQKLQAIVDLNDEGNPVRVRRVE
jgi:hypothetical protein